MKAHGRGDHEPDKRPRRTHTFKRDPHEHYPEPPWCSVRLFQEEKFVGPIHDPCCGWGRIPDGARAAGYEATGSDLVKRWDGNQFRQIDFFDFNEPIDNFVTNPPFKPPHIVPALTRHALTLARRKVAILFKTAGLNAINGPKGDWWIRGLPLRRVWLLTPRPSMPPGSYIEAGNKPAGGRPDYVWLIFEQGYSGRPEIRWLDREKEKQETA
jgi:hypothetical protein